MEGPYPKSLAYPRRNLRHAYKHVINTTVQCYYYEYEVNIKQDIHVQIMNGYAYIVTWLDDEKIHYYMMGNCVLDIAIEKCYKA